ncbi:MAG: hypothetical protein U1C12_00825, partial [Patescibacteria group bacterium]|nr:hypothetical protein [Patescibacteria group bacterium]
MEQLTEQFALAYENIGDSGDLTEIKKLQAEWEVVYRELLGKLGEFFPGELYDFLFELRAKTVKNIESTSNIHTQPDGTLAGQVHVGGKWLPFKGDTLIETIGGKEIKDAKDIHTQPD